MEQGGDFVVMRRFDPDTNGDGEITARFGDHGEPLGDWPTPVTVDISTDEVETWDEVVALSALGRWVVMRKGKRLVAISADKRWTIEGADLSDNEDPCVPSRKASVEPGGRWMTYLKTDPTRAVVKNLATGAEREFVVKRPLVRADPTPLGWVVTRELAEDTDGNGELEPPSRQGGCVCLWCNRFARSVGSGKMVGDDPVTVLIDPEGNRYESFRSPLPVAENAVWDLARNALFTPEGEPMKLGDGSKCGALAIPLGAGKIVVRCGMETSVWDPSTGTSIPVEGKLDAVELFVPPRGDWVAMRVADDDGGHRLGRLNVVDGRLETGPSAKMVGASHPSGWVLGSDGERMVAYDVNTGQSTTFDLKPARLAALAALVGEQWVVVDPSDGEWVQVPERPAFIASDGCHIAPHPMNRAVRGPFEYVCP